MNDDEDNDRNVLFDDDYEAIDQNESIIIAKDIPENCSYVDPHILKKQIKKGTTFYFNNIDGFKTNFCEFENQLLNQSIQFDFYCFNETNLSSDIRHNFELEKYHSEFF